MLGAHDRRLSLRVSAAQQVALPCPFLPCPSLDLPCPPPPAPRSLHRPRKFSLGSMVSQSKIRKFSRKIFHGLGYPAAASSLDKGQDRAGALSPGPSLGLRGSSGSEGAEQGPAQGPGEEPASPKRLPVGPADTTTTTATVTGITRVRSAHARDFFDLQQFLAELWTGIPVKVRPAMNE